MAVECLERFMRRNYFCLAMLSAAISVAGCSGLSDVKNNSGSGGGSSTVQVSPITASVGVFATQAFTEPVTGSSNTSVTWQANGVTGGSQSNGYISITGVYFSPGHVPTPSTPNR